MKEVLQTKQRGRHRESKHEKSSLELNQLLQNVADNTGQDLRCVSPALPDRGNRQTSEGFFCLSPKKLKRGNERKISAEQPEEKGRETEVERQRQRETEKQGDRERAFTILRLGKRGVFTIEKGRGGIYFSET